MLQAAGNGYGVLKPFGVDERYDVVVDVSGKFWRVQVKSSTAVHHRGYSVRACWRTSKKHMPYRADQVDFLAAYITQEKICYVIPIAALPGRLTIHLYPNGTRKGGHGTELEKYREAWELFDRGVREQERCEGGASGER
jgi:hypothetical protein